MNDRKRRARFSPEELNILVQEVELHKDLLFSKQYDVITNDAKKIKWEDITRKINVVNIGYQRTFEEVRKKWTCLQSETKKKICLREKEMKEANRGEMTPISLSSIEEKVLYASFNQESDSNHSDNLVLQDTADNQNRSDNDSNFFSETTSPLRSIHQNLIENSSESTGLISIQQQLLKLEQERLELEKHNLKLLETERNERREFESKLLAIEMERLATEKEILHILQSSLIKPNNQLV